MLFAYTKEKEMISAVESDNQQQFFCPDCGEELIRKAGKIKIPHFAHSQNTECYPVFLIEKCSLAKTD